jgi:tetratricopeptide (TPR) repeat protein
MAKESTQRYLDSSLMLIKDEKDLHNVWTKPRPRLLLLLLIIEAVNLIYGPQFFYTEGIIYKGKGWTEASRILMHCANFANPWSEYGKMAEAFCRICLPRHNIPEEYQQKNILAFNLDAEGKQEEAITIFEQLIKERPDFEWPFNNLANIRAERREFDKAQELSESALKINPDYANAHITLGQIYALKGERKLAEKHLKEGARLYGLLESKEEKRNKL